MNSTAPLVRHPACPPEMRTNLVRRVERALERASLAAQHRHALTVLALTLFCAALGLLVDVPHLVFTAMTGSVTYFGFITLHAVSPRRGNALYGAIGPPLDLEILPHEISAPEIRSAYDTVVRAHERIRHALSNREGTIEILDDPYRRCGDLVLLAGRIARIGNALHDFVENHDPDQLGVEIEILCARADGTTDLEARDAYRRTARARSRQLENYREFHGLLERIQARLELIAASLESLQALVVKVHARLLEQTAFAGETVVGWLDGLQEDLEILESALDAALVEGHPVTPPAPPIH